MPDTLARAPVTPMPAWIRRGALLLGLLGATTLPLAAQRPGPPGAAFTRGIAPESLQAVVIHPILTEPFTCTEHAFHADDPVILGDAAGADCLAVRYDLEGTPRRPPRLFEGDGTRNDEWVGWRKPVLAPFDGVVEELRPNPVVNQPGTPGGPPAGFIVFRRSDGTRVVYGHVQEIKVQAGDTVQAGRPVAVVGNNGYGYMPHTHVGAWRDGRPLQIRIDLIAAARLEAARTQPAAGR